MGKEVSMRVIAWCLHAAGTTLMILAFFTLIFLGEDRERFRPFSSFLTFVLLGGAILQLAGNRLRKGGEALDKMRT